MAKEAGVMDFYHRFQNLQVQRETSDSLIKVSQRDDTALPNFLQR